MTLGPKVQIFSPKVRLLVLPRVGPILCVLRLDAEQHRWAVHCCISAAWGRVFGMPHVWWGHWDEGVGWTWGFGCYFSTTNAWSQPCRRCARAHHLTPPWCFTLLYFPSLSIKFVSQKAWIVARILAKKWWRRSKFTRHASSTFIWYTLGYWSTMSAPRDRRKSRDKDMGGKGEGRTDKPRYVLYTCVWVYLVFIHHSGKKINKNLYTNNHHSNHYNHYNHNLKTLPTDRCMSVHFSWLWT